jgi:hypothetical protein
MTRLSKRDTSILAGLFLAKFDREGLSALGFATFVEAYNTIACGLGASPASIKNYRDELDPFFPNPRRGWAKRPIRPHCQRILDQYGALDRSRLARLVRMSLSADPVGEEVGDELEGGDWSSSFAERLQTGQAAERYFLANASALPIFRDCEIQETTHLGCGFDFRLAKAESPFLAVEVKGLKKVSGGVLLTDKEYRTAQLLGDRYFLFVVCGFAETPRHAVFRNPAHGGIPLVSRTVTRRETTWLATLGTATSNE